MATDRHHRSNLPFYLMAAALLVGFIVAGLYLGGYSSIRGGLSATFWLAIIILLYFIPYYLGSAGKHPTAIFAANLFFGWTIIGWIIVLIWALAERDTHRRESFPQPPP